MIPLAELSTMLMDPATPYDVRDAIFVEVVKRARDDGDWVVAICGLLLPGMRARIASELPSHVIELMQKLKC